MESLESDSDLLADYTLAASGFSFVLLWIAFTFFTAIVVVIGLYLAAIKLSTPESPALLYAFMGVSVITLVVMTLVP